VTSPYQRRFAGNLPPDEKIDGYLRPREVIDDDEGAVADRVAALRTIGSISRVSGSTEDLFSDAPPAHSFVGPDPVPVHTSISDPSSAIRASRPCQARVTIGR